MAPAEPPEIDRQGLNDVLDRAFEENKPLAPKRTRAVVVVQDGWVIAERYAQGIQPNMPLIATAQPEPPEINRQALNTALDRAFQENDPPLLKRTRAVVVVQDGWVIAERYAKGIQLDMPLIGWSMSKSITHALIGRAIQEGLLDPGKPPKVPEWSCLLYTSPSPRDATLSRMPSSA